MRPGVGGRGPGGAGVAQASAAQCPRPDLHCGVRLAPLRRTHKGLAPKLATEEWHCHCRRRADLVHWGPRSRPWCLCSGGGGQGARGVRGRGGVGSAVGPSGSRGRLELAPESGPCIAGAPVPAASRRRRQVAGVPGETSCPVWFPLAQGSENGSFLLDCDGFEFSVVLYSSA